MARAENSRQIGRNANIGQNGARRGSEREQVAGAQRARIVRAMLELCAEHGAANAAVTPIVERAGVSRRTFYELFDDCEDCLLAALDDAHRRLAERVASAWEQPGRWRERVRNALAELLRFLEADPLTGRLVVVETLAAGPKALERNSRMLARAIAAVEEGRREAKQGHEPPPLTGESVVGGVASVLHRRMLQGVSEPLVGLTGPLMSTIVFPYLGPAAARRELERPGPERIPGTSTESFDGSALGDLPIRVTYRTLCVLGAIASEPGASNRQVGRAAGIEDQGQISKLLARLERAGVIHNGTGPLGRGMPNAWKLTEGGERIARSLRV